ncbi:MAG: hypothetical protein ACR2IS_11280 [Nitrososphaeraceae archaeon]
MQQQRISIPAIAYVLKKISDDKTLIPLRNIAILNGRNHIPVWENGSDYKTITRGFRA